jgi:uncharacterized protein with HEPN domain
MRPKTPKLCEDIRDAAAFITASVQGRTLDDYRADRLLRQAVERNFEIIGEAMHRLAREDPATAARIGDYQRIIAFRNVLIHGYDLIDDAVVWKVIGEDLPPLQREVERLLTQMK